MYNGVMANRITIEYNGKKYHRYPDSKRRQLRVYYWRHDKWKSPPVALHRQIFEDHYGPIPKGYHIHHIDGNTENNSIDNLQVLPARVHATVYLKEMTSDELAQYKRKLSIAQLNREKFEHTCDFCGKKFLSSRKTNVKFCSRSCGSKANTMWEKAIRRGEAKCMHCGGEIKNRGRYCSEKCREAELGKAWAGIK